MLQHLCYNIDALDLHKEFFKMFFEESKTKHTETDFYTSYYISEHDIVYL